jgi:hypothetical protein
MLLRELAVSGDRVVAHDVETRRATVREYPCGARYLLALANPGGGG